MKFVLGKIMLLFCLLTICLEGYIFYSFFAQSQILHRISQIERTERDIAGISASLDWFKSDVGRYPKTNEGLFILSDQSALDLEGWKGPYINMWGEEIHDPWKQDYRYLSPGIHNQNSYDLFSLGIDGIEGSNDDINNWSLNKPWRKLYQTTDFFGVNGFFYHNHQLNLILLSIIIFLFCLNKIIYTIRLKI